MTTSFSHPIRQVGVPDEIRAEETPAQPWDWPLRLFHWLLVVAVALAIATGLAGGEWMALHGRAGLAIVALLAFRLAWGLVGTRHARFSQFLPTPARLAAYLRGRWRGEGHNPLGALSVFALLALLAAQVGTGLFGDDEIGFTGPLQALVAPERALALTAWHQRLAYVLFGLIGLHLAAIAFYRLVRRRDLLRPMLAGRRGPRISLAALAGALAVAVLALAAASGAWLRPDAPPAAPVAQPAQPAAPAW